MTEVRTIRPQAGFQTLLVTCPITDICADGGRGSGKSYAAVLRFLAHREKCGGLARGAFFRKTYKQMGELEQITKQLFTPLNAVFRSGEHYDWTFPDGSTLLLRHLDKDGDEENLMGFSMSFLCFDEAGNWPDPKQLDKLRAVLRGPAPEKVFMITCNPAGAGSRWIRDRYIKPSQPLVPFKWRPQPTEAPNLWVESIRIPSVLEDNPILMASTPDYASTLAAVGGAALYRAWRYGDWDTVEGAYFDRWDPKVHTYDPLLFKEASYYPRWIGIDWGYAHVSAAYWFLHDGNTIRTYRELVAGQLSPPDLARAVAALNRGDDISAIYLSHDAFQVRHSPRTIASEFGTMAVNLGLPWPLQADKKDRVGGAALIRSLLYDNSLKVSHACPRLIETIPTLQVDPDKPEDVLKVAVDEDDIYDAFRYGIKVSARHAVKPLEQRIMERVTSKDPNAARFQWMHSRDIEMGLRPDVDYRRDQSYDSYLDLLVEMGRK